MIKGGKGGAYPYKTGLAFEKSTSLEEALIDAAFDVQNSKVLRDSTVLGELAAKTKLYKYLERNYDGWESPLSSKLLPDEALFTIKSSRLHIIEKKWQEVSGSVDEKLQTCGFKMRQYNRLLQGTGLELKFTYLLNDWFAHARYTDVLNYIEDSGAHYHFEAVPLSELDLD
jgi:hypothetical protein